VPARQVYYLLETMPVTSIDSGGFLRRELGSCRAGAGRGEGRGKLGERVSLAEEGDIARLAL
jgi:hypothetical protein